MGRNRKPKSPPRRRAPQPRWSTKSVTIHRDRVVIIRRRGAIERTLGFSVEEWLGFCDAIREQVGSLRRIGIRWRRAVGRIG